MKYHTLFFHNLGKMLQNLSSAAVVIGALRVKKVNFRQKHEELPSMQCVEEAAKQLALPNIFYTLNL